MTFEEYINNPLETRMGGYTREIYRKNYTDKLNAVLVRENNKVDYYLYKNSKDGSYYMYMKIPSETVKGFTYDVVVRFKRPEKDPHKVDTEKDLKHYDVEFFSNDPAFVFNLEYTFKSKNMFVKDLTKRGSKEALTTKPKVTNPNNTIFYCKTIYWAYLLGEHRGLFVKSKYTEKYDAKRLFDMVMDSQEKITERQEKGESERKKKNREASEETRPQRTASKGMQNPIFSIGKAGKSAVMGKVDFSGGKKPVFGKMKSINFKK